MIAHLRTRNQSRLQILPTNLTEGLDHMRQSAKVKKELIEAERDFIYRAAARRQDHRRGAPAHRVRARSGRSQRRQPRRRRRRVDVSSAVVLRRRDHRRAHSIGCGVWVGSRATRVCRTTSRTPDRERRGVRWCPFSSPTGEWSCAVCAFDCDAHCRAPRRLSRAPSNAGETQARYWNIILLLRALKKKIGFSVAARRSPHSCAQCHMPNCASIVFMRGGLASAAADRAPW